MYSPSTTRKSLRDDGSGAVQGECLLPRDEKAATGGGKYDVPESYTTGRTENIK
jgi:hypothetical protein